MLIGYGDDHRSSLPAVLTSNHLVREVPRTLVPDERGAVLARRPLVLASIQEGLAAVSMRNVLAMLITLINVHHIHIVGYTMSV
jgi:hypothetical protein